MFQASRPLFLYALSPIHMGAGTAVDIIDNPVQREVHTHYPVLASAGLKGAFREALQVAEMDAERIKLLFGPETSNASAHAGALSFTDGMLVLFPVRALDRGFVYATTATALARLARLVDAAAPLSGLTGPSPDHVLTTRAGQPDNAPLVLETLALNAASSEDVDKVAAWLADTALPDRKAYDFFRQKIQDHLVVLSDEDFSHFLRTGMVVEPHVRINDDTGTADDGGLFFTENVPPESLFVTNVMASRPRRKGEQGDPEDLLREALDTQGKGLDGAHVQIGGDATTGRGQVVITGAGDRAS